MAGLTYGRWFKVDRSVRVQDEVEQGAVVVVRLELDLKGRRVVKGLGCGSESGLDVVGLLSHAHSSVVVLALVLDLLLVVGNHGLLLAIGLIVDLESGHNGWLARESRAHWR